MENKKENISRHCLVQQVESGGLSLHPQGWIGEIFRVGLELILRWLKLILKESSLVIMFDKIGRG